jgi:hypothetical protein
MKPDVFVDIEEKTLTDQSVVYDVRAIGEGTNLIAPAVTFTDAYTLAGKIIAALREHTNLTVEWKS